MHTDQIIKKFKKTAKKPVTAKEIGATSVQLSVLEEKGLIVRTGVRPTGKRGRPAFLFVATVPGEESKNKRKFRDRVRAAGK